MILDEQFHHRYGPVALVAGASEGIGAAFAHQLAEKGLDLILLARRLAPLEEQAHLLRRRHGVRVEAVSMDLGAPDLAERIDSLVEGKDIGLLVYNACYSKIAPYLESDLESKLTTIDVNCRGPVVLTSVLGPQLVARGRGGMLLMSSMSGLQGTALVSTYAASKAFNTVLGEGLWTEFAPHGVDVLVCVAGATSTPNFEAQTPKDKRKQAFPMSPDAVVHGALGALSDGPVHIAGTMNRIVANAMRVLSRKAAISMFSKATRNMYG
jgi:uncharacterized protein